MPDIEPAINIPSIGSVRLHKSTEVSSRDVNHRDRGWAGDLDIGAVMVCSFPLLSRRRSKVVVSATKPPCKHTARKQIQFLYCGVGVGHTEVKRNMC